MPKRSEYISHSDGEKLRESSAPPSPASSRDAFAPQESRATFAQRMIPIFTCTNFNNSWVLLDRFIGPPWREFQYSCGFT
jgi:hypothetical protein